MTREEQIRQEASEFAFSMSSIRPELNRDSFMEGAKWADKTMIDKACLWLRETAHFYVSDFTGELDDNGLIEDFKKAMEE